MKSIANNTKLEMKSTRSIISKLSDELYIYVYICNEYEHTGLTSSICCCRCSSLFEDDMFI